MTLTYEKRVCVKCKTDPASERFSCHTCHRRFCFHHAVFKKGDCIDCQVAKDTKRESAA
jgi:hypothetical protein